MSVATVEVPVAGEEKGTVKKRDLAKIGRHLARQITRQGITEITLEAIMEAKRVDRVQAKSVVAHATKALEAKGLTFPAAV